MHAKNERRTGPVLGLEVRYRYSSPARSLAVIVLVGLFLLCRRAEDVEEDDADGGYIDTAVQKKVRQFLYSTCAGLLAYVLGTIG